MDYTIPSADARITLQHDSSLDGTELGEEQSRGQNTEIVAFAHKLNDSSETKSNIVAVEVFYERNDFYKASTSEDNYDAVLVDLDAEKIVGTLPPYSEIDPEWKSKREASHE